MKIIRVIVSQLKHQAIMNNMLTIVKLLLNYRHNNHNNQTQSSTIFIAADLLINKHMNNAVNSSCCGVT